MQAVSLENIDLFTAPEGFDYDRLELPTDPRNITKIFLAGGITGCRDWQSECVAELDSICHEKNVWVFNPRREDFDVHDPLAATKQIEWEFRHLEEMDIFSMYFCASETSVGPICLYELGRYLCRMQMRFPDSWTDRVVVSVESGYSRQKDVVTQLYLAAPKLPVYTNANPEEHAAVIMKRVRNLRYWP